MKRSANKSHQVELIAFLPLNIFSDNVHDSVHSRSECESGEKPKKKNQKKRRENGKGEERNY